MLVDELRVGLGRRMGSLAFGWWLVLFERFLDCDPLEFGFLFCFL
jgi:hypothetical protein